MKPTFAAALSAAVLVAFSGCSLIPALDDRAVAVWELAPQQSLDPATTTVSVLVSRLGCNDGVTGTVNPPAFSISDSDVVITFTVSPGEPAAASCPGNNQIAYEVSLPEPLGDRRLVDGACETTDARDTIYCDTAVRD